MKERDLTKRISDADLTRVEGLSSRQAARVLGVGKSSVNETRARRDRERSEGPQALARYKEAFASPEAAQQADTASPGLKILAFDAELTPNLAHVWGLWDQNIGLNQLLESQEVICWGARWLGSDETMFASVHHDGRGEMLAKVHALFDEADVLMGWNSKAFDMKHLNREFYEHDMPKPSPMKHIDLLQVSRQNFKFPSQKLQYVSKASGLEGKKQTGGHELWIKCMAGDPEAWETMKEYQLQDVDLLIDLYAKMRSWIPNHPSVPLYDEDESGAQRCRSCGSGDVQKRGRVYKQSGVYQQYRCNDCGSWFPGGKRIMTVNP
jgi:DNA polymerase elongation subunit (family B)